MRSFQREIAEIRHNDKARAHRNRTITLSREEADRYDADLIHISKPVHVKALGNKIVNQDIFDVLDLLPEGFVDLLILDPPYNLTKTFTSKTFRKKTCFRRMIESGKYSYIKQLML